MSKVCPACLGKEFSFENGPCNLCNHAILGFKILVTEAPHDFRYESRSMQREGLLRGIAEVMAETLIDVAQTVEKPF